MNKLCVLISITAVAFMPTACGSYSAQKAAPAPTPANAAPPRSVLSSNVNSAERTPNNSNASVIISNAGPPSGAGVQKSSNSPRDRRFRQLERVDVDPSATPPPPTFQAAPENSDFAAQMEKGGEILETRVFKSHPLLKKVEIRWIDPKTKSLKVTLKNGKIVERKAVGIANLRTASSAELLNIIGMKTGQK